MCTPPVRIIGRDCRIGLERTVALGILRVIEVLKDKLLKAFERKNSEDNTQDTR